MKGPYGNERIGMPPPPAKGNKPTDHYCTPKELTDLLPEFDLDPCSNPNSTVRAKRAVMLPEDGLAVEWRGLVWCNPPYSNVAPWVERAALSHQVATTVMLIKLDPTTKWWRNACVLGAARPFYFRRRIKFTGAPSCANFPSALLVIGRMDDCSADDALILLRREGWIW